MRLFPLLLLACGVARPGAKMTQMEGSLAAPMLKDGAVHGTIGVAKPTAYDFSEEETSLLMAVGALHLPGAEGLVEDFRKAGYTVTAAN